MAEIKRTYKHTASESNIVNKVLEDQPDTAEYVYVNAESGLSEESPIDIYVPAEELISEDYVKHTLTSDMLSLDAVKGKIPIADPETGRLRSTWISDQMVSTNLPLATPEEAVDPNNNDSIMSPKTTHIAIYNIVKDATVDRKGVVQLTSSLNPSNIDSQTLAVTPYALKNYLASQNGGFAHAGYEDHYGITAYADETVLRGMLEVSKTNTNATLKNNYSDLSVSAFSLYDYIANNNLTLNKDSNIEFSTRSSAGSTTAPTIPAKISVNRSDKSMTITVNSKDITIANTGNVTLPGTISAAQFSGPATKLTTSSAGSNTKFIYFSNGVPVASTTTLGGTQQPVYISNGEFKLGTNMVNVKVNNASNSDVATTATKLGNTAAIGGTAKPVYFSADGVPVAISATVGNANTPVYLNGGTITSTGKSFANYLPLAGGTMTGPISYSSLGGSWVSGAKDKALINMTNTGSFGTWLNGFTKSYKVALGTYPGSNELVYLYSVTKDNADANTNTTAKTLSWDASNGTLTANSFSGNATSASKVNNKLKIKTTSASNGYVEYDGSVAKTIDKVYAAVTADSATSSGKLGSATVGGTAKPIYLNGGTATAISATVGSGTKPVYLSGGTITASSSTVGSSTTPIYLNGGTFTAIPKVASASNADYATNANYANSANTANSATSANKATQLANTRTFKVNIKCGRNTYTGSATFNGTGDCEITLTL